MISEVEELGAGLGAQLRRMYEETYSTMVDSLGCDVYVKTIYVGFSLGGEMVAAIYPHKDCLEIALALPEDVEGTEFRDATHLTWPTMPVCVELRTKKELGLALGHLKTAAQRVREGQHDVRRPNEHFMGRIKRGYRKPDC